MSSPTHIYIVVGSCADGSVVLVHSSPAGVRLSGTPDKKGRTNSEAVKLAKKYMKKYYFRIWQLFNTRFSLNCMLGWYAFTHPFRKI